MSVPEQGSKSLSDDRGYAVMTYARCGSNWLAQLLGSTGLLGKPEDWFNGNGYHRRGETDYPLTPLGQLSIANERGRSSDGLIGVKLSATRLDELSNFPWCSTLQIGHFIHLVRADRLARAISDVIAHQTNRYRSTSVGTVTPVYDRERILNALTTQVIEEGRMRQYFAMNGIEPLELTYEELAADPTASVQRIATFLAVPDPVRIDPEEITLQTQRDATNAAWRDRFVAELSAPDMFAPLTHNRIGRLRRRFMATLTSGKWL